MLQRSAAAMFQQLDAPPWLTVAAHAETTASIHNSPIFFWTFVSDCLFQLLHRQNMHDCCLAMVPEDAPNWRLYLSSLLLCIAELKHKIVRRRL